MTFAVDSRKAGFCWQLRFPAGADLANVLNEAALLTARNNMKLIDMASVDESIDRVMAQVTIESITARLAVGVRTFGIKHL